MGHSIINKKNIFWIIFLLTIGALSLVLFYLFFSKLAIKSIPGPALNSKNILTPSFQKSIGIGFGLSSKTLSLVSRLSSDKDFVDLMLGQGSYTNIISQLPFPHPSISCIARSLDKIREVISITDSNNFKCDFIGYNPEQREGTPVGEMDNFVESTKEASEIVHSAGSLLVNGPGLKYMIEHEDQYVTAAAFTDAWVIQSQGYQIDTKTGKHTSPEQYASQIARIAGLLRQGNPKIKIWVQIIITPGMEAHPENIFSAQEVATLAKSIENDVDAIRIYQQGTENGEMVLGQIIDILRPW